MSVLKNISQYDLKDPALNRLNWNFDYLATQLAAPSATSAAASSGANLYGTHANRTGNTPPLSNIGRLYFETDRNNIAYQAQYVSNVATWVYVGGVWARTQAQVIAGLGLGTADTNLLVSVTDYAHVLQWNGSGFQWGPDGDDGVGTIADSAFTRGTGWALCDGSTGVKYLKSDGSTGTVNLPNSSGAGNSPSFAQGNSSYSATINPATAPTVAVANNIATENVTITGVNTAAPVAHSHTATASLSGGPPVAYFNAYKYFRQ